MSNVAEKKLQDTIEEQSIQIQQLESLLIQKNQLLEELEKKQLFFEDILAHLPGHVYWLDKNNVYIGCNDEHAETAGLKSRHQIVGKTNLDMSWRDQAELLDSLNNLVMRTGQAQTREECAIIDNINRTYLSKKVPLKDKNKNNIGVLCISIDITSLKKMEEELICAKEKAEVANYIMTEFISNMGHDLATPISDIGSVAQMLSLYENEYPELKDLIDTLIERSEACEKVRRTILNATSISSLDVQLETFSTAQVLLDIEKELRPLIGSKPLTLSIHPLKPKKDDEIETDRLKLHEILSELITNAINFTEKGHVCVTVSKKDDVFHIKVSDTGIGIPSDKYDFIFQQYTKLSRSNKYGAAFKGVGAGLYLAKIRANILNASIGVESEVNRGSTFTFSIPAHAVK